MSTKMRTTAAAANEAPVAKPAEPVDPAKARALAALTIRPSANAAAVIQTYGTPLGGRNLGALIDVLTCETQGVLAGDMKQAEAMLFGQAHALQSIFMNLSRRAESQDYLKSWEANLRMAMKAQNQCRMTLETLATIKNPPVVFARQANINNGGQQQVNYGTVPKSAEGSSPLAASGAPAPAGISESRKSELLEANDGQGLDTRTAGTAVGANRRLATVGEVNRAAHG